MIGGCGSSGTTLLAHVLNVHPSIHCGPELYLLNKRVLYGNSFPFSTTAFRRMLSRGLPTTGLLDVDYLASSTCRRRRCITTFMRDTAVYGFTVESLCQLAAESGGFRDFVDRFFEVVLARTGKDRWAEKTPTNCYCIGEFLSLYPCGKYVHVVRDGRDVVPSLVKRGAPPENAVRRWVHDTASGLPWRTHSRYHEIRYEELVTGTEGVLADLMGFLGEGGRPEVLIERARTQPLPRTHGTWNVQPSSPISMRAMGKWKGRDYKDRRYLERLFRYTVLSDEVGRAFGIRGACHANDVLSAFGYDSTDEWDVGPGLSLRIVTGHLQERAYQLLPVRKLYCRVSLS